MAVAAVAAAGIDITDTWLLCVSSRRLPLCLLPPTIAQLFMFIVVTRGIVAPIDQGQTNDWLTRLPLTR